MTIQKDEDLEQEDYEYEIASTNGNMGKILAGRFSFLKSRKPKKKTL